jgi:hypothetical protein
VPALTSGFLFVGSLSLALNLALSPVIADRTAARMQHCGTSTGSCGQATKVDPDIARGGHRRQSVRRRQQSDRLRRHRRRQLRGGMGDQRALEGAAGLVLGRRPAPAGLSRFWVHDPNAYPLF